MADTSYTDARVIELSKLLVCVIANSDTGHGEDKDKRCKAYRTIPCSVHQRGMYAGRQFFPGNASTPTTVFCDPSGKELFRKAGAMNASDLVKNMQAALAQVPGDKAARADWSRISEGNAAIEKAEYKKAIEAFTRVSKVKRLKDAGEAGLKKVAEKGESLLQEALELADPEAKKKALKKIADDFKPLEPATKAKKALESK